MSLLSGDDLTDDPMIVFFVAVACSGLGAWWRDLFSLLGSYFFSVIFWPRGAFAAAGRAWSVRSGGCASRGRGLFYVASARGAYTSAPIFGGSHLSSGRWGCGGGFTISRCFSHSRWFLCLSGLSFAGAGGAKCFCDPWRRGGHCPRRGSRGGRLRGISRGLGGSLSGPACWGQGFRGGRQTGGSGFWGLDLRSEPRSAPDPDGAGPGYSDPGRLVAGGCFLPWWARIGLSC